MPLINLVKSTLLRYLTSGISVLFLDYVLYILFVLFLKLAPWWADFFTTPLIWIYMFIVHKYFTFSSKDKTLSQTVKFIILSIINTLIMPYIIYLSIIFFGINFLIAKLLSVGVVVTWNYFMYKHWVYK